jgi:hypothetical protein
LNSSTPLDCVRWSTRHDKHGDAGIGLSCLVRSRDRFGD